MLLLLLLSISSALSLESIDSSLLSNHSFPLGDNGTFSTLIDEDPQLRIEKENDEVSVWSQWIITTPCNDTCGSCGRVEYTRECICAGSEDCPCSERESRVEVCSSQLCQFPRRTCCEGFTKTHTSSGLECAPVKSLHRTTENSSELKKEQAVETIESTTEEDSEWTDWAVVTPCSDTCGACGRRTITRKRKGGSNRETRVEVCANEMCKFPRRTCCEGFQKDNQLKCGPINEEKEKRKREEESSMAAHRLAYEKKRGELRKKNEGVKQRGVNTISPNTSINPSKSIWGEWKAITPCSDTCGGCGRVRLTRECACKGEEGCPCSESQSREDPCGMGVCKFPRRTCCKGFTKVGLECQNENAAEPDNVIISPPSSSPTSPIHNDFYFASRNFLERQGDSLSIENEDNGVKREEVPVWGEWTVQTPCTDTCGACGRIHLTRECLCSGEPLCPCRDRESRYEVCAAQLCHFPRQTCCKGFLKVSTHDGFKCVSERGNERICAGEWTVWNEVARNNSCPSACGMCGKRKIATRKCEPESCECSGEKELFESCGSLPCREGVECCEGFIRGRVDGREECVPSSAVPPALSAASRKFIERKKEEEKKVMEKRRNELKILSVLSSPSHCEWGQWIEIDSECSASCGMCGVRVSARRNCHPDGCNCTGPSTRYEDCGEGICEDRKKPCCGFYQQATVNGVASCIDPVKGIDLIPPVRRSPSSPSKKEEHKGKLSTSTCRGIWSPFSASLLSSCDHSCGLCGHRTVAERQCIPEGCTCEGSNKLYERCGEKPCFNKTNGCCEGASIVLIDGARICKEIN